MYDKLIADLKEDAEWAEANEWETPIMLSDHIKQAIEAIEMLCKAAKKIPIISEYGANKCFDCQTPCQFRGLNMYACTAYRKQGENR